MAQKPSRNTLYYGDNLPILRQYIPDESVDLVYLDPPFNSNRSYNVLFREESGEEAAAQITAFDDTWHWNEHTAATYHELVTGGQADVSALLSALRQAIGTNQMMAYLVMMAARLVELHRALKPTGSLYLHCDPTASHYLKVVMDAILGVENFRNEIVWQRTNAKGLAFTSFAKNHDVILRYTKSTKWTWNAQYTPHNPTYVDKFYRFTEQGSGRRYRLADLTNPNKNRPNLTYEFLGVTRVWRWTRERMQKAYDDGLIVQSHLGAVPCLKRYLDEQEGTPVGDTWFDTLPIQAGAQEQLGYPTQKPVALLERIISASSNPGDVVLDPFCGCGTTIAAAQKLDRQWIGIDITHLSIALLKYRLKDAYGLAEKKDYDVVGEPEDLGSARQLAQDDRYQFQWWALSLIQAKPLGGAAGDKKGKKGSDQGIDGIITFVDDPSGKGKQILVQVKSGKVKSGDVRDLRGAVEREGAAMGVFISLEPMTADMRKEAASADMYTSPLGKTYPRLQLFTIEELMAGAEVKRPSEAVSVTTTFKKAGKVKGPVADQLVLDDSAP